MYKFDVDCTLTLALISIFNQLERDDVMGQILYRSEIKPTYEQAYELYSHCTLGGRRPIEDRQRFQAMLDNVNLIITAWG